MFLGWTGVAARAVEKMMGIETENSMPGHRCALGRLSDTHELTRVQTMLMMLIWHVSNLYLSYGQMDAATYTKRNDVDFCNGKARNLPLDIIALDPEDHCIVRYRARDGLVLGNLLDPPDWPSWELNVKNNGTETISIVRRATQPQVTHRGTHATSCASA